MTFLILTRNEIFAKVLKANILEIEKSAKTFISDFSKDNIKKQIKNFDKLSLLVIYNDTSATPTSDQMILLSSVIGNAIAKDIIVLTNIAQIKENNVFGKESITLLNSKNEIIEYIKQKYETIQSIDTVRGSKKKLLSKGIPFTPDCFATYIAKNKTEICNLFLSGGMDLNSTDENGTPLLNVAVRNDNEALVKRFIQSGVNINAVSQDRGYTPVMDAVWRGNKVITKLLIKEGADLNTISKEGQSNLVLAVGADRVEICKLLAENGADPDIKDMMGMSAYGYATLFKKEEIIKILKPFHKEN